MLPNLMKPKTFFSIRPRRLKTEADQQHWERLEAPASRKVPRISSSCTRPNDNDQIRQGNSNGQYREKTVEGLRELNISKDVNSVMRPIRRSNKPYKKQSLSLLDNLIDILRLDDKHKLNAPLQVQAKNQEKKKKYEPIPRTKIMNRFVEEKHRSTDNTRKLDINFQQQTDNLAENRQKMASEHTNRRNAGKQQHVRMMDADPLMTFFPVEYCRNLRIQEC